MRASSHLRRFSGRTAARIIISVSARDVHLGFGVLAEYRNRKAHGIRISPAHHVPFRHSLHKHTHSPSANASNLTSKRLIALNE